MNLRLLLLLGIAARKLLWEVLKRRDGVQRAKKPGTTPIKVLKSLVQLFLAFQTLFLDIFPMSDQPDLLRIIGTVIFFVGLATTMIGRHQLGENWTDLEDYQVLKGQSLVTHGIYRFIRHPIYTGDLLLFIGLELALNSWLVLTVFLLISIGIKQALKEEAQLSPSFSEYDAYCKQTKRFIPFVL